MNASWIATTKASAAAIGALVVAALAFNCGAARAGHVTLTSSAADGRNNASALSGIYRVTWSQKELLAAGAPRAYVASNFGYLQGRQGGITIKLRDGQFRLQEALLPHFQCSGTYSATKTTVAIHLTTGCFGRITARWSLQSSQLRLRVSQATDPGDKITFGAKPWKKIG